MIHGQNLEQQPSARPSNPLAIYVHWPFCKSKCPYCDFNSHVAATIDHTEWKTAYQRELEHYAARLPGRRITSVFFGGGTPSLMAPATVSHVLDTIARLWPLDSHVEITLEANPTSSEAEKFTNFRAAGVTRVSLGIQALNDDDLRFLGREHSAAEARHALELVQKIFPRNSFDLIYARRNQSITAWESELRQALDLARDHLSLYQLTIEPSTQFYTRHQRGEALTAPDDAAATMYEITQQIMGDVGLPSYEISNHARLGEESRHNLTYWHYDDYIGIGPGAHGRFIDQTRLAADNHRAPEKWLAKVRTQSHGLRLAETLDTATAMREALMMGLRLANGISLEAWDQKFGLPLLGFLRAEKRASLQREKFIEEDGLALKATTAGRQRLNAVINYLLD